MENKSMQDNPNLSPQNEPIWPKLWRGMRMRCPRCNQGKLFRSYLKPVEHCSNCNQPWAHVRADLAPAWAAMTISAHVTVLIWHFFFWGTNMANWMLLTILCSLATAICLISLPAMKGLFMAIIWAKGTTDS